MRLYMKLYIFPVLVILFLTACATTPVKRNFSEVIDDAVISNRLKVKYLKDDTVSGFDVNIDTFKGVVTLKGQVADQSQIDQAILLAERENGVKDVKSYLYIDDSKREDWAQKKRDEKKAARKLKENPLKSASSEENKKMRSAGSKRNIEERNIGD